MSDGEEVIKMAKKKDEAENTTEEKPSEEKTQEEKGEVDETSKRLAELEKKLGENSDYISKTREFIDGASVVIQTIAGSPELTKSFQQEVQKKYGVVGGGEEPIQQNNQNQSQGQYSGQPANEIRRVDERVSGVETSQREQIIHNFEASYGIGGLNSEEKAKVRKEIGSYLADFGWKIDTMPLQVLQRNLEKAYVGTQAEKLREEGKLEGITKARELQNATIGSFGGTAPETSDQAGLTDKQKEWARRLKVDEDDAAKLYKTQNEDQDRVPLAEKQAKQS